MDALTVAELMEQIVHQKGQIDAQFQLWLTITFATIVASYAASNSLPLKLRFLVCALYLLVSFSLLSRLFHEGDLSIALIEHAITRGSPNSIPTYAIYTRISTMILGTISTMVFLFYSRGDNDE